MFETKPSPGAPTKIDYRKKGTLIQSSLLEDLVVEGRLKPGSRLFLQKGNFWGSQLSQPPELGVLLFEEPAAAAAAAAAPGWADKFLQVAAGYRRLMAS